MAPFRPTAPAGAPPRRPTCKGCGAEVIYLRHQESGKPIPLDPEPVVSDGRRTLVVRDEAGFGAVRRNAPEGTVGYVSHFATCPEAGAFRRRRTRPRAASPAVPPPPVDPQLILPL